MSLGKRLFLGDVAAAGDFCMNTSDNPLQEATSSLVAGYSLDYDASDITGDYDGTASNVTFGVDGEINWGAEFNGTSSKISIGNPIGVSDNFTISAWFNASSGGFIYGRGVVASSGEHGVGIVYNSTNGNFYLTRNVGTSTLYYVQSANNIVPAGQWNFIAATFDRSGGGSNGVATIYANGSQVGQQTNWNTNNISYNGGFDSGVQVLGERGAGGFSSSYITGTLDQVRVFNRALDSDEVDTLYNESACTHTATTDTVGFPSTASSNLVAYYKLDGSAEDESSNDNDGTPSNVTYEFGRFGTAAKFNGSSSKITVPLTKSAISGTNDAVSVSWWMNAASDHLGFIFEGNADQAYMIHTNTSGTIRIGLAGENLRFDASSAYTVGEWTHFVATFTNTEIKLYKNGNSTPIGSDTHTAVTIPNFTTAAIGWRDFGGEEHNFDGKLDQVRIYDKVLTSDEVEELYNEKQAYITKDASDPFEDDDEIAFYKFENNANDSTGSNNGAASNVTYSTDSLFGTYAASFNGSSSKINTNYTKSGTTFSFSCWVNVTDDDSRHYIFGDFDAGGYDTSASTGLQISQDDDIILYCGNGTTLDSITVTDGMSGYYNQWVNLVVTIDGTSGVIYRNGSSIASGTFSVSMKNGTNALGLGTYSVNTSGELNGKLDQVRLFDRALDGDEVFKLYAEVIN